MFQFFITSAYLWTMVGVPIAVRVPQYYKPCSSTITIRCLAKTYNFYWSCISTARFWEFQLSASVQAEVGSLGGKAAVCGADIEGTPNPVVNSNLWLPCHWALCAKTLSFHKPKHTNLGTPRGFAEQRCRGHAKPHVFTKQVPIKSSVYFLLPFL